MTGYENGRARSYEEMVIKLKARNLITPDAFATAEAPAKPEAKP